MVDFVPNALKGLGFNRTAKGFEAVYSKWTAPGPPFGRLLRFTSIYIETKKYR
jgi:hypothetical protein